MFLIISILLTILWNSLLSVNGSIITSLCVRSTRSRLAMFFFLFLLYNLSLTNLHRTARGYTCHIQLDARLFHVAFTAAIILRGPTFKPRHMERNVANVVIRLRSYWPLCVASLVALTVRSLCQGFISFPYIVQFVLLTSLGACLRILKYPASSRI